MYIDESSKGMKVGHPLEMPSKKRGVNYSFYMDPVMLDQLELIRRREAKSMSAIVRRALDEYIKSHAEGNDTFTLDQFATDPDFRAIPTLLSNDEKWIRYIKECDNDDLTKIGLRTSYIHGLVKMRRTKEFLNNK